MQKGERRETEHTKGNKERLHKAIQKDCLFFFYLASYMLLYICSSSFSDSFVKSLFTAERISSARQTRRGRACTGWPGRVPLPPRARPGSRSSSSGRRISWSTSRSLCFSAPACCSPSWSPLPSIQMVRRDRKMSVRGRMHRYFIGEKDDVLLLVERTLHQLRAMLRYSIYLLRGKSSNKSEPLNFQELNPS